MKFPAIRLKFAHTEQIVTLYNENQSIVNVSEGFH